MRDARELRAWQANADTVPAFITNFRIEAELLRDGRRRNEMLVRGILCRSVTLNARDWFENKRFQELTGNFEAHHVIPDEYLKLHYRGAKDPVANFVLLTERTNKRLLAKLPRDVVAHPDLGRSTIPTHPGLSIEAFEQDAEMADDPKAYIERFLSARAPKLEDMIYEAVGVPKPEQLEPKATAAS